MIFFQTARFYNLSLRTNNSQRRLPMSIPHVKTNGRSRMDAISVKRVFSTSKTYRSVKDL